MFCGGFSVIDPGMKMYLKIMLFVGLLLCLFPSVIWAQAVLPAADPRPAEVAAAEQYLQSLKTVQAHFVQTAPDGHQTAGTFYLSRPGKLRFEYDPPVKDFVVADGVFIYFYDGQLNQQSNAPIGETLADFLLRRNLKLSGDVTVTKVEQTPDGLLAITLTQTADANAGQLTLLFQQQPTFQLVRWRVVDGTGAITEVALSDMQTGMKLPGSLFVYKNPHFGSAHYNQ